MSMANFLTGMALGQAGAANSFTPALNKAKADAQHSENMSSGLTQLVVRYQKRLNESIANAKGVVAIQNAALAELAKLDPNNWVLKLESKRSLYDAAYEEKLRELEGES